MIIAYYGRTGCIMVIIAAAFAAGVYLADIAGFGNIMLVCMSGFLITGIRLCLKQRSAFIAALAFCAFFTGAAAYKFMMLPEFYKSSAYIGSDITVTGRICDVPHKTGDIMSYTVDVRDINGESIKENICIYSDKSFDFGDTAEFTGKLKSVPRKMNESGFDSERYYLRRGISARLTAKDAHKTNTEIPGTSIFFISNKIRNSIDKIIDKYYTQNAAAAAKAVLTGDTKNFSGEFKALLYRTATAGIFYPSYIHALIILMFAGILTPLVKKKYRDVILGILLIVYALFNTAHASFVRAFMYLGFTMLSGRFLKKRRYSDIIAFTVLVTGLFNPLMFYDAGFLMSLSGALIIKTFYPYEKKRFPKICENRISRTLIMHVTAIAGIMPLCAYYFEGVSAYSAIITIVSMTFVTCILLAAPAFLLLTALTGAAPVIGQFMTAMISGLITMPYVLDKLPFSLIPLPRPSVWFIAAYFLLLMGAAYLIRKKTNYAKGFFALAAVIFIGIFGVKIVNFNTAEFDFVNVGQGDGAVVSVPMGGTILIDGGGGAEYSDYNVGEEVYLPYLIKKGITSADAAFVSHYHKDHAEGIEAAIENIKVKNLFLPSYADGEWRERLESAAQRNGANLHYIDRNTTLKFNSGLSVQITVPDTETLQTGDENDMSLLINVSYGEFNCLFTGDMTVTAEKNLMRKGKVPQSEVLKVPHHGSRSSASEKFFDTVSPQYAVISLGEDNVYNFPSQETVDGLKGAQILRTDECGDIRIRADKNGIRRIDTLRDARNGE